MRNEFSKQVINRAVDLWCRKLHTPVFDNGDDSEHGGLSTALATLNIQNDKASTDNMTDRIEVFRAALTSEIVRLQEDPDEYLMCWLATDYGPEKLLADAANKAGIPTSQFSVKSTVQMNDGYVSASFGYGAGYENHYPLPDGSWLITTLTGSDIDKVISSAISGNPLELTIEAA